MQTKKVFNIEPLGFQWKAKDPFLFCVHHEDHFPAGNEQLGPDPQQLKGRNIGQDFTVKDGWRMYHGNQVPGFPSHPHRGFETVTVVREGLVDHSDSMKAAGRYGHGDVQWMTAGKGIQHAEMFPLVKQDEPNPLELFQIWLNLPAKSKMVEPYFKMLWADTIPQYTHLDQEGKSTMIEVIAGQIANHKAPAPPPDSWAADRENDVAIWNIHLEAGARFTLPEVEGGVNRVLYFYQGDELTISETKIAAYHMAELAAGTAHDLKAGSVQCRALLLQGKPIGEPVYQYGPFVMNYRHEIEETFDTFRKTAFGGWPWSTSEPTHGADKGRFALYADGRLENP
ncbi:MAG: pirin family protein [Prolixibacteraceae bacterium]|nr:pirin family protein [Prolixibacteraceae bacterium]